MQSGAKAAAALDTTITFVTKNRLLALGCLARWFDFCRQGADFTDGVCDAARLRVYSDHCIKQVELKDSIVSSKSALISYCMNMSSLWVVWTHQSTDSDKERKDAFDIEYTQLRRAAKQRFEQKYDGASSSGSVQRSVSPRETPDISGLNIGCREDTSNAASDPTFLQGASLTMERAALAIQQHLTNANGATRSFDSSPMDHEWRVFSYDSDAFLHSVLLRRSSQCSLQMRLWHALSVSTWLDTDALCKGITLGSLSLRSKRLSAMANANVIAIQTKRSYDTASRQTSSGSAIDGKELRNSRSASEGGQFKVELLRNRRIVLCPWNALAVHLYHKWHVLKEPPPDFSNPEWADEPLFQDGAALSDAHLQDFCDEHYREYKRAFEQGKQTYKCISQRTFAAMDVALSSSRMLRGAVSSSRTLHATQRVLQNGIYDKMLVSIAGFSTDSRAQPYHIARQHHGSFAEYEDVIFPFADYVPAYSENGLIGIEANHRQAIVGFCNVLKLLRTVLLQDAALMLYTPFYRQMLKHSSVFGQSVFLSDHFRDKVEAAGEALMTVECMPMYSGTPRDTRLGRVVPAGRPIAARSPASTEPSADSGKRLRSLNRQISDLVKALPVPLSGVAGRHTSGKLGEELDSLSVARVRELNDMLDQSPRLADTVADQPWSGEPSKPTDMSVAHPANEEPSQDPVSSRASFSKESSSTVDELPTTKRRRTEANTVSSTMLRNVAAPKLHPVSNQRGNDNSSQRRESILSPSASMYLIEDEDGNFFDMPAVNGSFIEILDYDEGSDETVVATDGLGKASDIQAIAPSDEGSSSPMDWEKISYEAVTDISFNIPTPEITPEAAVPESDSATEATHFPEPTLPISSEGNDKLRQVEALQIPSDAPVSVYTTALAHNISELCRKKKLLLKSNIKLHKSLFAMRVFPKRITSLRAKTASALVKNGVVDIQAIEKMRKLNMWLHRTKEALAKLEEAVSSNNDLLCELMGSGVEEAVGCAVALLSQQSHDGTGQV
ncbi:hypothetical protein GGI10_002398 [Coemansia sp. RSA 2530]|nr:hypothetical protein GGI10_002398 [Coemansia sp. RSA 2530]